MLLNRNVLILILNVSRMAEYLMLLSNWFKRVGDEMEKALGPLVIRLNSRQIKVSLTRNGGFAVGHKVAEGFLSTVARQY